MRFALTEEDVRTARSVVYEMLDEVNRSKTIADGSLGFDGGFLALLAAQVLVPILVSVCGNILTDILKGRRSRE